MTTVAKPDHGIALLRRVVEKLEEEKKVMLQCMNLNSRETGTSWFSQRAIACAKEIEALQRVIDAG